MKNMKRFLAVAMIAAMSVSVFASCGGSGSSSESSSSEESSTVESSSESSTETVEPTSSVPLVYAIDTMSQKFNPLWYSLAYDGEVCEQVVESLMNTDRSGMPVYNGIEGETREWNGTEYTYYGLSDITVEQNDDDTTTYTYKLREGVLFSDGEEMNIDDVIFTWYVAMDPSYVGNQSLTAEPIVGLQDYQTQTSAEVYEKYAAMADYFAANGDAGEYGEDMLAAYNSMIEEAWITDVQGIVDYVYENYASAYASEIGVDEITDDLKVAFGMVMWGFADYADGVVTSASGDTFDIANGTYPVIEDYYNAAVAKYGDAASYDAAGESATGAVVVDDAKTTFISEYGSQDESMGGQGVPNVAGIKRIDDYTASITVEGYSATTIYNLNSYVIPLHYYGDESKYDYDNNQFGFDYGDVSSIQSINVPMGTGPYVFDRYENKVVYFTANENYWKGAPETKEMQFKETQEADKVAALSTGTADVTNPSGSKAKLEEIASYNSNGEVDGDVLTTSMVDNRGYGYVGINANTVNVGGEPGSEASKNLRKALATVIAVYRSIAMDSYYGDAASVIEYNISNTSWAAPQPTDEGYTVAYSTDVDGNPIYTADMTNDEKYAAAIEAAKNYLIAAGYTWDEASGKFTAAPEGAKLGYEVMIPGGGTGEHPSFMLLEYVRDALSEIGITLTINDLSDTSILWSTIDSDTQEMWCAAWSSGVDPDMYSMWHSDNVTGKGSEDNNGNIVDAELDALIMDGRTSTDQNYRKAIYKQCLDIINDWATSIPIYQRQNVILFSPERIDMDSVTPDITTNWNWYNDLQNLKMVQ